MVQGGHEQNAASFAVFAFGVFEVAHLKHDREALDQEDAAEKGQQQLLADAESEDGDDAADGERAGIAHEDLCREAVVPEEADQRTGQRRCEDDQFAAARNVHDVQVVGIDDVSGEIGQDAQHQYDRGRYPRHQAVESVREVGAVRNGRDHQDRHDDVENPSEGAVAAREPAVIEFVVLDEGNRGLGRLTALGADDAPLDVVGDGSAVFVEVDRFDRFGRLFPDDDVGREAHGRTYDNAQADLSHDLETPFEPLFVVAEDFDVVVQKADQPQPDRRNQHQLDIDVVELSEKQYGDENGQQDDYAAHRGRAFLLELSFEPQIADLLTDLFAAQEVDDVASEDDDDQQGDDDGCRRAERNVLEHTCAGQVVNVVEIFEKMIEHVAG